MVLSRICLVGLLTIMEVAGKLSHNEVVLSIRKLFVLTGDITLAAPEQFGQR